MQSGAKHATQIDTRSPVDNIVYVLKPHRKADTTLIIVTNINSKVKVFLGFSRASHLKQSRCMFYNCCPFNSSQEVNTLEPAWYNRKRSFMEMEDNINELNPYQDA